METPEIRAMLLYLASRSIPHRVASTIRPGAITAAGFRSRHADGLAVDFGQPVAPDRNTPELLAIFKAFEPVEHLLHELIYSGSTYSIKNGMRVPRYAIANHFDHVHVSVDRGVLLPVLEPEVTVPEPEIANDDPNNPNLNAPIFGFYPCVDANGMCQGYYVVSVEGEVHGWGPGAKFHGRSDAPVPTT